MRHKSSAIARRKALYGRLFVLPWVIGFLLFFLLPLGQSIQYSFSKVSKADGKAVVDFIGLDNYRFVWMESLDYRNRLKSSLLSFLPYLAIIVVLSLILAVILNQKFRGRLVARAVFFLPVIIAAGVVMQILNQDVLASQVRSGAEEANTYMYGAMNFGVILENLGLPDSVVEQLLGYLQNIFKLIWSCGVQIILFIAALQAVPDQLYEVSRVEGATAWENFWFITLPMIGNILIVVIVYTVIDLFTNADNEMMNFIYTLQKDSLNYDISSAILVVSNNSFNDGPICDVAFFGSNDGQNWEKFAMFKGNTDNELRATFHNPVEYQYVKFQITKLRANQDSVDAGHRWFSLAEVQLFGPDGTTPDEGGSTDPEPGTDPEEPEPGESDEDLMATKVDALEGEPVTKDWSAGDYEAARSVGRTDIGETPRWMDGIIYANGESGALQSNLQEWKDPNTRWIALDLGKVTTLTGFAMYSDDAWVDAWSGDDLTGLETDGNKFNDGPVSDVAFYGRNSDTEEWVKFAVFTGNTDNELLATFTEPVDYRYVKFDITKLRAHFGELGGDNGWINLAEVVLYGPVSEEQEPVVQPAVKVDALEGESVTKDWTAEDYTARVTIPAHTGCQQGERTSNWMNGVAYTDPENTTFEDNWMECKDPTHWNLVIDLQQATYLTGFKLYSPDKVVNAPNENHEWVDINDGPICDVAFYGKNAEGDDWVKFSTFTGNTDNELTAQFAEAVDYRYVKFEITKIRANQDTLNSSDRWFNVAELELYGTQE